MDTGAGSGPAVQPHGLHYKVNLFRGPEEFLPKDRPPPPSDQPSGRPPPDGGGRGGGDGTDDKPPPDDDGDGDKERMPEEEHDGELDSRATPTNQSDWNILEGDGGEHEERRSHLSLGEMSKRMRGTGLGPAELSAMLEATKSTAATNPKASPKKPGRKYSQQSEGSSAKRARLEEGERGDLTATAGGNMLLRGRWDRISKMDSTIPGWSVVAGKLDQQDYDVAIDMYMEAAGNGIAIEKVINIPQKDRITFVDAMIANLAACAQNEDIMGNLDAAYGKADAMVKCVASWMMLRSQLEICTSLTLEEMQPEDKKMIETAESAIGGTLKDALPESSSTMIFQARALTRAKTLEKVATDAITQYMQSLESWVSASPSMASLVADERVMVKYIKDLYEALRMIVNIVPFDEASDNESAIRMLQELESNLYEDNLSQRFLESRWGKVRASALQSLSSVVGGAKNVERSQQDVDTGKTGMGKKTHERAEQFKKHVVDVYVEPVHLREMPQLTVISQVSMAAGSVPATKIEWEDSSIGDQEWNMVGQYLTAAGAIAQMNKIPKPDADVWGLKDLKQMAKFALLDAIAVRSSLSLLESNVARGVKTGPNWQAYRETVMMSKMPAESLRLLKAEATSDLQEEIRSEHWQCGSIPTEWEEEPVHGRCRLRQTPWHRSGGAKSMCRRSYRESSQQECWRGPKKSTRFTKTGQQSLRLATSQWARTETLGTGGAAELSRQRPLEISNWKANFAGTGIQHFGQIRHLGVRHSHSGYAVLECVSLFDVGRVTDIFWHVGYKTAPTFWVTGRKLVASSHGHGWSILTRLFHLRHRFLMANLLISHGSFCLGRVVTRKFLLCGGILKRRPWS